MLQRLKQSALGKRLYRLSRGTFGAPLRGLARLLQHEALNPAHLSRRHRAHNAAQIDTLARFKARTGSTRT